MTGRTGKTYGATAGPHALREKALGNSMLSALAVNALNGILISAVTAPSLVNTVSLPLILLLAALFGPCTSLLFSFLYPLLECQVGRKLGSEASFADLYRIFAWSFLPVGPAAILSGLAGIVVQETTADIPQTVALTPLLIGLCYSTFSYYRNAVAVHHLSKPRVAATQLVALVILAFLPTALLAILLLLVQAMKLYFARRSGDKVTGENISFTGFRNMGIAIVMFYALLFTWILLYDEELAPPVAKALSTPLPDSISPDNGWLALIAFTSPEDGPPFPEVEKRLLAIKAAFASKAGAGCDDGMTAAEQQQELVFSGKPLELYSGQEKGFQQYAAAHPAEVERLLRDNARLLERYTALYGYRQYTEPLDWGYCTPLPHFAPIRNTQKAKFLGLAQSAQQGGLREALRELQQDAELWRRIARESRTLLTKLVSIAMLTMDLQFAAELGATQPGGDEWQIVQNILRPFDQGETSFAAALEGEAIFSLFSFKAISQAAKLDPMVNSALLKANASRNRIYAYYQQAMTLAELPPTEFASITLPAAETSSPIRSLSLLYNPVGEILQSIARPEITGYLERGHALECLRRLAWLKTEAGREKIATPDMPRFLETHRAAYGNPFTGEPMSWDAEKRRIFARQPLRETDVELYLE